MLIGVILMLYSSLIKVKIGLCQIDFTPRYYILRMMNI